MSRKVNTLWIMGAVLSLGVALFSYRYLLPHPPVASPDILGNLLARPWLPIHAGFAATALIVGPCQFLPGLRARRPGLHRIVGRTYVVACLVAAVAGLLLATRTTAGPVAGWGFGALAVCWFFATSRAVMLAIQGRIAEHRQWMIRSWAMTFAAVTLRLYLPIPPMLLHMSFMDGYRAIAWLAWVPNLLVAELSLRGALRSRRVSAFACGHQGVSMRASWC